MKRTFFLFLLFSITATYSASALSPYRGVTASRHQIKTGMGIAFSSTESMWGYSMHSEYNYHLNKNISLATGLAVLHFRDDTPQVLKNNQVESLEVGVYTHFLQTESLSFHLGGGGNLRYFHWALSTPVTESYSFNGSIISPGSNKTLNQFTVGYSLSAGFGLRLNDKMRLIFQEQLQNDNKQNITWDSRISLLVKF